jgi:integrase
MDQPTRKKAKQALTQISVGKLKAGERYDGIVPGFGVRATADGTRSWIFVYSSPTQHKRRRYTIGRVDFAGPNGVTSYNLEQARRKASALRDDVAIGMDPADERAAAASAAVEQAQAQAAQNFAAVFALFTERKLASEDRGWEVKQIITRELLPHWKDKAINAITARDVEARLDILIRAGKRPSAHRLFEVVRRMFNWAAGHPSLGLDRSPMERMQAKVLIGKKTRRKRVLSPDEIGALWRASARIEYPYGALTRLLLLTGLRLSEAAEAVWGEFEDKTTAWVIPAARMKSDDPHVVPLTEDARAVLATMPRFSGEHLFTCNDGSTAVTCFSKPKRRLDALMLDELRALAVERGRDPAKVTVAPWEWGRDVRRTVRTNLSALPVPHQVRELIIAHARPELDRVYDQWEFFDEKHEALTLWAARLRSFIAPLPENVVPLRRAAAT